MDWLVLNERKMAIRSAGGKLETKKLEQVQKLTH
jgi:hypothetical protein